MAKKKTETEKLVTKQKNKTKRKVKKSINNMPKKALIIAIIIILIIAIVCIAVAYNKVPSFKSMVDDALSALLNNNDNDGNNNNNNNNNNTPPIYSEGELSIHFIDIGQGDSILISFPDGRFFIIDGGDNSSTISNALLGYLGSIFNDKKYIDYMMLTHTDSDHVGSLDDVLDAYEIGTIYMPKLIGNYQAGNNTGNDEILGTISTKVYYDFYSRAITETYSGIIPGVIKETTIIYNIGILTLETDTYKMTMYCPEASYYENLNYKDGNKLISGGKAKDINNMSPIIILEYAGVKVCFTGDADDIAEKRFMQYLNNVPLDVDVLKIGHHGSEDSTNQDFFDFLTPEYSVISVGAGNTYLHPRDETLNRIKDTTIYRTDLLGHIVLTINGENGNITFTSEKEAA